MDANNGSLSCLIEQALVALPQIIANANKRTERIRTHVFGESIIGIADFLHLNPSLPNRELSGLLRLARLNEVIGQRYCGLRMALVAYDYTLPRSEAAREGGGFGFSTAVIKRTVPAVPGPDVFLTQQPPLAVDPTAIISIGGETMGRWLPAHSHARIQEHLNKRLRWLLQLYNDLPKSPNAATHILNYKRCVYNTFDVELGGLCHLATDFNGKIAMVLEELFRDNVRWYEMPVANERKALFFLIGQDGTRAGIITGNGKVAELCLEGNSRVVHWDGVIQWLRDGRLIPSVEVYLLTCVLAPGWLHFGNRYGRHKSILSWYEQCGRGGAPFVGLGMDGQNSIPLGATIVRAAGGMKERALLLIDCLIRSNEEIREAAARTSESGLPAWPPRLLREMLREVIHD